MELVLSWLASIIFLARLLPQPARLARTGVPNGVSPLSALNAVVAALAWTIHGVREDQFLVWFVSVLSFVPSIWMAALLRRRTTKRDFGLSSSWLVLVVGAPSFGMGSALLGLTVFVTNTPQMIRALRAKDLSGVSVATWRLAIADAIIWGLYGYTLGDSAMIGYLIATLGVALVILRSCALDRARREATSSPRASD